MMARRTFIGASAAGLAGAGLGANAGVAEPGADSAESVRVRRLSWAGVALEAEGVTLFVDPWEDVGFFGGRFPHPVVEVVAGPGRRHVLLTHLHRDHFDRAVIRRLFADEGSPGSVVVERAVAAEVASEGFRVAAVPLWEPRSLGAFLVTPVPAVDGWGAPQVGWSIVAGGRRFFHGGDGLWHGRWWDVGRAHGPYDVAFLPINGARTPGGDPPVGVSRTLGPEEAAEAGRALGAQQVVPIHYGVTVPGQYEEAPDALTRFMRRAAELGVRAEGVAEGGEVRLP